MSREISAGIIIYRKTSEGIKYLLLYHGGNYWNFPKGKLEQSERGMDAAFREVKEETDLGKNDLILKDQFRVTDKFFFFREKKRIFKIVIFYLAQSRKREVAVSMEHNGYGWFTYKEAMKIVKFQNLRNIIKKANDILKPK
ncbi:hypothetical protein A2W54_03100 [Candidatus Giovannonibacteria bacterium RIFCSPHIGHO2_02_43_13]|uniref:Bis(5'-nucleosyl)-tetraphosphatase [asymmetrical] n=1 Tax=Candidatus Giovannonibacteria bacterium RIFCSPHIGHO2_02_43_13 TaxID=1798330 RepID=A0A1F5WQ06_9BACT|nr:MAG: hypothetical protein UW28_C0039G0001 [Parcubacteria group bacterium GW2011_GWA2_44_13]OGF71884.1 MAG: hypothetical protein A3E06_00470 [Candidatus Giovannonibacteria bacterium RIFCSPHIGHO2_12_FULL_44_42]OGF77735.1 MAG: hypothetical protein A2W54_03100 [Candidatus Giovannonibacteria bacterium RIFCSPHIGHO2_02_43_13]OGF90224.1 MAG: hypothetical protein A3I94_03515 [Candidatus Giovannonibacteria bacterium RIFCSPLOWO2_02_FULL_43_54]OGF96741.1 MAG: hypothetical protein A3H08_02665 [Candidatus